MTHLHFYIQDSETADILLHISDFEYMFLPNKGEEILLNDKFYTVTNIVKSYKDYGNTISVSFTAFVEHSS